MSIYYLYPNYSGIYQNNSQIYLPQMNNNNIINNANYLNTNNVHYVNCIPNQGIQASNLVIPNIHNLNNRFINNYNGLNQQIPNNLIINNNNNNLMKNYQSNNLIPYFQNNNNIIKNFLVNNPIKTQISPISNNNIQNKDDLPPNFKIGIPKLDYPALTSEQIKKIIFLLTRYVCKIYMSNGNFGTGFFCRIPYQKKLLPVLITNNHVLDKDEININKIIKFTMDDDKIEKNLKMDQSRIRFTNEDLDVTLIEIKPNVDGINHFFNVVEDLNEDNYKNKLIFILQYPNGEESSHSIGAISDIFKNRIIHFCATDTGSSGSPILSLSNSKVIGVHRRKGIIEDENITFNEGVFIKYVIEEFNKSINNIGNKNISNK